MGLFKRMIIFMAVFFAKMGNLHSASCEGNLPPSSIDFWTFRVSEIEANGFSLVGSKNRTQFGSGGDANAQSRLGSIIQNLGFLIKRPPTTIGISS